MFNKKAIFVNTASQIIVRVVTLVLALIATKLLSNYLGTAGVGNYNTITTYINFFIVIADLGLFSVTVREIAKNPADEKKILSNAFSVRLISALATTLIAIVLVFLTNYSSDIKLGVLFASGFLIFNLLASIYDVILQYRLKMQYSALAEFFSKVIALLALYLIIKFSGNFLWIISTVTLSGVSIFVLKYLFSKRFVKFSPNFDAKTSKWILSIAWPIGIVFVVNNLFFKIDSLILYAIKGPSETGIYSVAYKVLDVTIFVGAYFASSLKTAISENVEKNKQFVAKIVEKSFYVMLLVSLPISILGIIFSREIILLLSNQDFISGAAALVVLSFVTPFIYFDMLLGEILLAEDRRKLLVNIAVIMLSFNVVLNIIVIPIYSFIGAAYVTLASEILLFAINYYYTRKILHYKPKFDIILKILLAAIITVIASVLLRKLDLYFIIVMLFAVLIYILSIYSLQIVNGSTIKNIVNEE